MNEYLIDLVEAQRAVEFLQEDLDLLQGPKFRALGCVKAQMKSLHKNLGVIRSFLKWMQENSDDNEELQALVKQIRNAAAQLLVAANSCIFAALDRKIHLMPLIVDKRYSQSKGSLLEYSLRIDDLVKQVKPTGDVVKGSVFTDHGFSASDVQEVGNSSRCNFSKESDSHISVAETMVGFNDETQALLDRLIGNQKQLQVISITGMAGIGKTTLAQRSYNDQVVVFHFHIRGWASVSQVYQKNKVLSSILTSIPGQKDSFCSIGDQDIGEKLYKCLKGNRYLIVIDDIWNIGVWNDIKMYFPNDGNGSRILITTRITDVASNVSSSPPHCLRFLSPEESWHLFTCKVFADKICPHELKKIGKKIVAKCKGLPLAIVVVAGLLLKKEKTHEIWTHVAQNIGPLIDSNEEQIMDILALSYGHLPEHLKICFIYLSTFPEDYEIPVKTLIRSWIAVGCIKQTEEKRLEDRADDYLMELVNRNLVIVAKKRSTGGTKTCHIHDMVRELCIRKALEKKLIIPASGSNRGFRLGWFKDENSENGGTSPSTSTNLRRSLNCDFLRVLNIRQIISHEFPTEILMLFHLKYLALQVEYIKSLPRRLYLLWNLETFILHIEKGRTITVPYEIWKMEKLRHMDISSELEFEHTPTAMWAENLTILLTCLKSIWECFCNPPALHDLQTISHLRPSGSVKKTLARTPNLRKLGFHLNFSDKTGQFSFPDLASLKLLESVKFEYQTLGMKSIDLPPLDNFPPSLKKLTLIGSHVNWEQTSILGLLPNLEVLKIKDNFFSGPRWETSEDGFRCLRFLKLSHMDLQQWITSDCHFPKLEQLVLNACLDLVEIPSAIGDICTLQVIKLYRSSSSVANSARQIQESQRSFGNDQFKVFIYPQIEENV